MRLSANRGRGVAGWLPWLSFVVLDPLVRLDETFGSADIDRIEALPLSKGRELSAKFGLTRGFWSVARTCAMRTHLLALLAYAMKKLHALLLSLLPSINLATARAQTFEVDFSRPGGPPLARKFGVYQTPLVTLPRLLGSVPLLSEAGVRDFRYEMGWGKPDALAHDQISGGATNPTYDFSTIDALVGALQAARVRPLLAMGYCPSPLKGRAEWAAWKDAPGNMDAWERINHDYASHLRRSHPGVAYEVWNEPDMPEPGGKMFFSGGPDDYARLYRRAARGLRAGDSGALIGGPAIAYDLGYMAPILDGPLGFASIHAYDNFQSQIANLRGALSKRPNVPIFLTEYASFTEMPPNGPQSRSVAAMRFFRDARALLAMPDVAKVYWAQWLDAGESPGMGLITWDGHRKAIFNAFKVYGMMPTIRAEVSPDGADGINLLASSDSRGAGVVLWNENGSERSVRVTLRGAPLKSGTMQLFRIDAQHASFVDNPASEHLRPLQSRRFVNAAALRWTGRVPAQSVVFLRLLADTRASTSTNQAPRAK